MLWGLNDPEAEGNRRSSTTLCSHQEMLSMGASLSPLSSRAQSRDLQFRGPFLEMFFDSASLTIVILRACDFFDLFVFSAYPTSYISSPPTKPSS
jgi:hypothetical protein